MRRQHVLLVCAGIVFLTAAVVALYRARDRFLPDPSARVTPEDERLSADEPDPTHGIDFDYPANRVVRKDAAGATLWSTRLEGYLGRVRPPHVQADEVRAYVTHADGVTALDVHTGAVLWRSPGPANGLLVSGPLLFATGPAGTEPERGPLFAAGPVGAESERWVLARDVATGKEVFRAALPANFDARAVEEMAGLIVVQNDASANETAYLINRAGGVLRRLDRRVAAAHSLDGGGHLVLTNSDVLHLSDTGDVKWSAPFRARQVVAGGGFIPLPNGDVAAFLFGWMNDSGVQLVRLDPATGAQRWAAYCKSLGVPHSEYYHTAVVKLVGDRLRVTSRGSSGTFVEVLDAGSGRSVGRDQRNR